MESEATKRTREDFEEKLAALVKVMKPPEEKPFEKEEQEPEDLPLPPLQEATAHIAYYLHWHHMMEQKQVWIAEEEEEVEVEEVGEVVKGRPFKQQQKQ
ncbi:hypothetical protein Q9L58_008224 [Maublancomyces gigas]|uniref:Uncharacterized protein n=1 Tax=Discina gigas TaxID=1032678 RepID=A0ABR3GAA0_9PEZI